MFGDNTDKSAIERIFPVNYEKYIIYFKWNALSHNRYEFTLLDCNNIGNWDYHSSNHIAGNVLTFNIN